MYIMSAYLWDNYIKRNFYIKYIRNVAFLLEIQTGYLLHPYTVYNLFSPLSIFNEIIHFIFD